MTLSEEEIRKLIAEELSNSMGNAAGVYVLMPPPGSRFIPANTRNRGPGGKAPSSYSSASLASLHTSRPMSSQSISKSPVSDPLEHDGEATATPETFEDVAREWFENNTNRWVPSYLIRKKSRMESDLLPALGQRFMAEIEPMDVLEAVRAVEGRGAIETAKRILHMASAVFRYGVGTGRCQFDPTIDLKDALKPAAAPKRRTALPARDLPAFMAALERYDGDIVTKMALKLLILTFVGLARSGSPNGLSWKIWRGQSPSGEFRLNA